MKSKYLAVLAALVVSASSAPAASAGTRTVYQVTVNDTQRWANGTMTDARGSADSVQSMGCYHNATFASCFATNAAGLGRTCTTSNAGLIEVIRHATPESYIYFQWNTDGTCNYVLVENNSRFKPGSASGF